MNRILEHVTATQEGDGVLLQRFLDARDDAAFAEIVARHGPMVYGVCLRLLRRCQDAEDTFQVVFLRLARNAVRLGEGDLGGWLYTVARRVSLTAVRGRRRRRWVFWEKTPEPEVKRAAEVDLDLDAAIATLTTQERSAVILCHLEGRSRAEAAKALGIPEGTLSTRLAKALEKLRRKLGKPPLAVLAGGMVVMLPDSLPASTLGLVHHLRDGTLEDWAAPRMLDLYQKAFPMRLLDRFGPVVTSVVAAALVLVGAAFGWHIINAQPPKEDNLAVKSTAEPAVQTPAKKSFAAAVEEMQKKSVSQAVRNNWTVELRIEPNNAQWPWAITASEVVNGGRIQHQIQEWPSLGVFLKQVANGGTKKITVNLSTSAVRSLEANHVVNLCKNAGFTMMDYTGPELFVGDVKERREAAEEPIKKVSFEINLLEPPGDLPDWSNGWAMIADRIVRIDADTSLDVTELKASITKRGGVHGPAAGLAKAMANKEGPKLERLSVSDFANQLNQRQQASRIQPCIIDIRPRNGSEIECALEQLLEGGTVLSAALDENAIVPLLVRTARFNKGRFLVRVGSLSENQSTTMAGGIANPLSVNDALNGLKRGGVTEFDYVGQPIFTGQGEESKPFDFFNGMKDRAIVRIKLRSNDIHGELPDTSNGWTTITDRGWWIVRSSERERFHESLKSGEVRYADEVARLAKLPTNELENELAKKPSLLRNRWRKDVEEAKKKSSPRTSQHNVKKVEDELAMIDEQLAYMKWRLKPSQYERSAHVQVLSGRREKLKGQMEKF